MWVVKNRTSDGRASCGLGAKFKNGNWEAGKQEFVSRLTYITSRTRETWYLPHGVGRTGSFTPWMPLRESMSGNSGILPCPMYIVSCLKGTIPSGGSH